MIKTDEDRKQSFIQMVAWCAIWLTLLAYLQGCTFHAGVDWVGETKKDNRSYSGEKKQ